MKLINLERVLQLRNYRRVTYELMSVVDGAGIDCSLHAYEEFDPFQVISADPVRRAIKVECLRKILEYEAELRGLQVELEDPLEDRLEVIKEELDRRYERTEL